MEVSAKMLNYSVLKDSISARAQAGLDQADQLARGVGDADRLLGQGQAEAGLDAAEQLDALEAAEAELALERGVEAEVAEAAAVADGGDQVAEDLQQGASDVWGARVRHAREGITGHAGQKRPEAGLRPAVAGARRTASDAAEP